MWSRDRMKSLALSVAAALAAAVCSPGDKPAADAAKTESNDSAAPAAVAESQMPTPAAASIPASAADGPGLHRVGAEGLKLPVPRSLDLSHVDPAHFAAALGRDPQKIFTYVRDNIAFEPYQGALRGPRGTLLAMAGNSVDRAALLAAMLASSRQKVRFVHGTLPQPDAERLVTSVWADRSIPGAKADNTPSPEVRAAGDQFVAAAQRDGKLVVDMLQKAGHPAQSGQPVTLRSLAQETQDHYWVESSPDGKSWTAMDPSFATAEPGKVFAEPQERFDSIPEAMYHHIELRVRTEEAVGGGLPTREVLKYAARAADLSGVDVFLGHEAGQGADANRVRPLLVVRRKTTEGEWFWLKPPTAGNASVTMVDALGGAAQEAAGATTAETIEIDFANPDGSGETVIREVFDRIGKHRRAAGPALSDEQIAALTSAQSVAGFTAGLYDLFLTTGAVDPVHLTNLVVQRDTNPNRVDVSAGLHRVALAYTALSDGLTSRVVGRSGAVVRLYPDTPRLIVAELTTVNGLPQLSLDLRRERARAVVTGFRKEQLFLAQVLRGVVAGTLERAVTGASAEVRGTDPAGAFGTSLVFELAKAQKVSPLLVTRDGPALRDDLPENGRARLEESLEAGHLVIAPQRPIQVAGASRYAWWEIEPRSGATTAVTDEGLHQATVEARVIRDKENGTTVIEVRTGNGLNARYRYYRFNNDAEMNEFISYMDYRFQKAGVEVIWEAAGI
jgi:hypothetical protein